MEFIYKTTNYLSTFYLLSLHSKRVVPEPSRSIHELPDDLLCEIFQFLALQSVDAVNKTCKRWHAFVQNPKMPVESFSSFKFFQSVAKQIESNIQIHISIRHSFVELLPDFVHPFYQYSVYRIVKQNENGIVEASYAVSKLSDSIANEVIAHSLLPEPSLSAPSIMTVRKICQFKEKVKGLITCDLLSIERTSGIELEFMCSDLSSFDKEAITCIIKRINTVAEVFWYLESFKFMCTYFC